MNPVLQAFLASLFTWGMTAVGALLVFFRREPGRKFLDGSLAFAGGIMIGASFWSLLVPAVEMAEKSGTIPWIPVTAGFILGSGFVLFLDRMIPHIHPFLSPEKSEGIKTSLQRSVLLVLAVTIHNIPEGIAVGVAFGSLGIEGSGITQAGAVALALGIGIQNLPEGFAVSMPLRREGFSALHSFCFGQASGLVEIAGALLGALAVTTFIKILPYAFSFAAGAMMYVVIEELIPESQSSGNTDLATISALLGVVVMTLLDVALG